MEQSPDDPTTSSAYSIRAVERVCDVLDLIQRHPQGFSLTEVIDATDMPKSTAFRYLSTLESRRYVERDLLTGQLRIGPAFLPLQSRQLDILTERARPTSSACGTSSKRRSTSPSSTATGSRTSRSSRA